MILSRNEVAVLRRALETQERVMTERSRPAAATAAHLLRRKLDVEDPVLTVEQWDDLEQEVTGCRFGEPAGCDHPDCHDWFERCSATDDGERCGFPSLDSAAWYMHGDHHEGLRRVWGSREVAARKEQRRAEVDRG